MPGIHAQGTDKSDLRLREALEDHKGWYSVLASPKGRMISKQYVFPHIVVWLPRPIWNRDQQMNGRGAKMLAHNLSVLHQQDFRESLNGQDPRYDIRPRDDLPNNQVCFQFGHGVFLPEEKESPVATLMFRVNEDTVDFNWYQDQNSLIISPAEGDCLIRSPVTSPFWWSPPDGYIIVNRDGERWNIPEDGRWIKAASLGTHSPAASWTLTFRHEDGQIDSNQGVIEINPILRPTVTRRPIPVTPKTSVSQPAWGETQIISDGADVGTVLFSHTPTEHPNALLLEGIALPRIDNGNNIKIQNQTLQSWTLWFDDRGNPLDFPATEEERQRVTALQARNDSDRLWIRPAGQTQFQKIFLFPPTIPGTSVILASPMPEKYLGIYQLPTPNEYLFADVQITLGRQPTPPNPPPDILLELLSQPESLAWSGDATGYTLSTLGVSRGQHLTVQVRNSRLEVQLQRQGQVYLLRNSQDRGIQALTHGGASTSGSLAPGDCLLIGCYFFCFHFATN